MNPNIHGPILKGKTRKQLKGRRDRAEARVKKAVRAHCVERDGHCRVMAMSCVADRFETLFIGACEGPSQWAHFGTQRRAHTRGQVPDIRHTTAGTLMLCEKHHGEYDCRTLVIAALSKQGCDGPLKFARVL